MIGFDASQRTINLSTRSTTYQMKIDDTGVLLHTYYGQKLRGGDLSRLICPEDRGFSPNPDEVGKNRTWSLDTQPQEYSSSGVGDFRTALPGGRPGQRQPHGGFPLCAPHH